MALMALLPSTAASYALRGAVTGAVLLAVAWLVRTNLSAAVAAFARKDASFALLGGIVVLLAWIAPEFLFPESLRVAETPYAPDVCGWPLTLCKLFMSAFVISCAEELFFRKALLDYAGFGAMLVLFGVEHARFDLGVVLGLVFVAEGVLAGLVYGLLAKRCGLLSAIIAHTVTNFVLGLHVVLFGKWFYW